MSHYRQQLTLAANPATVYAALTTPEGLRGWWTQDCDVATEVGETIHFRFNRTHKEMRIEKLDPGREVRWFCTGALIAAERLMHTDEWVGTQLVFRLAPEGDGRTRLNFEHVGLAPTLECYDMCSNGWQYYMNSLQKFVNSGRGTPHELAAVAAA